MNGAFDTIVVGAGPGGMAAASVAAEAGTRVCLVDSQTAPGGQLWRGLAIHSRARSTPARQFSKWARRLQASKATILCGWRVVNSPAKGVLRVENDREFCDLQFQNLILATGARERFLPFPGWTLPGVLGVGGLQALLKSGLEARGKRVVVAGTGPLLLAVAAHVQDSGGRVEGIFEQAPFSRLTGLGLRLLASNPRKLLEGAGYRWAARAAAYRPGVWVTRAEGDGRVERVMVSDGQKQWTISCDWLACGYHLVPNLELPLLLGCQIAKGLVAVDQLQRSSVEGIFCVGELTGIGGLKKSLIEGQMAGLAAVGLLSEARSLVPQRSLQMRFAQMLENTFRLRAELRELPLPETPVCRCEDVCHAELLPCTSSREAKLHTRCGMGACQGRICGEATQFLYGWESLSQRPPVFPARIETLADWVR